MTSVHTRTVETQEEAFDLIGRLEACGWICTMCNDLQVENHLLITYWRV